MLEWSVGWQLYHEAFSFPQATCRSITSPSESPTLRSDVCFLLVVRMPPCEEIEGMGRGSLVSNSQMLEFVGSRTIVAMCIGNTENFVFYCMTAHMVRFWPKNRNVHSTVPYSRRGASYSAHISYVGNFQLRNETWISKWEKDTCTINTTTKNK